MSDVPGDQIEEPVIDRRSAHVGIVCTQKSEIAPLLKKLDRQKRYVDKGATFRGGFIDETIRVACVEAGSGFANHRQATLTLIAEHNPAWILSVGFSSPLISELNQGDVCLANEICDTHGNCLPVRCSMKESKRIFVRKHVVADAHPALTAERSALHEASQASAVDTSSMAVAQACVNDETTQVTPRFMSIRGIIGKMNKDLPPKAMTHLFEPDPEKRQNVLLKLTSRFKKDPELAEWDELATETATNLNRFVLGVVRQLAEKLK